jgi:serine/threonine protein kinase
MGTVYEVHDAKANRNLALKLLPRARAQGKSATRFVREAQALAQVNHPNVVTIHDVGEDPAGLYYVMDLVPGQELGDLAMSGVVPERDAAELTLGVAEAVAAIHAAGLLHRDVKPDNVVLRADRGTPILLDFGLALSADSDRLTKTGQIVGTPHAMSPEQASGSRELTPATDVYGVGVILYMLLARQPPFEADQLIGLLAKVCQEEPTWPEGSPGLIAILRCAMAKDPDDRYPSADELRADLERFLRGERVAAAPPPSGLPLALSLAGVLLLLLSASFVWLTKAPEPSPTPTPTVSARPTRTRRARPRRDPLRELSHARATSGAEGRRLMAKWLANYPERPEGESLRRAYLTRGLKEPDGSWQMPASAANLVSYRDRYVIQSGGYIWSWAPEEQATELLKGGVGRTFEGPGGWLLAGAPRQVRVRGKLHKVSLALISPEGKPRWAQTGGELVTSLAKSGDLVWAGHEDGSVAGMRWSMGEGGKPKLTIQFVLPEFKSPVASIAFDPKHQLLFATCGEMVGQDRDAPDRRLVAWSLETNPPTKRFDISLPGSGGQIRLHPTRDLLVISVLWVQELRVYDYQGNMVRSLEGLSAKTGTTSILAGSSGVTAHSQQIRGVTFLPSGILLSSAGKIERGEFRAWDVIKGEEIATKTDLEGVMFDILVTPRGEVFTTRFVQANRAGLIERWDLVPRSRK